MAVLEAIGAIAQGVGEIMGSVADLVVGSKKVDSQTIMAVDAGITDRLAIDSQTTVSNGMSTIAICMVLTAVVLLGIFRKT